MRLVRLLALPRGARVPPPRPRAQALRRRSGWRHAGAGGVARGGGEVRAPVRELPRGGRGGRRRAAVESFARLTAPFPGSSIGRAFECLSKGFWFECQPRRFLPPHHPAAGRLPPP